MLEAFDVFAQNTALSAGGERYKYADLGGIAFGISEIIQKHNDLKSPVAILGSKGFHTYAGICGSLFASCAYMPLNLRFPAARNAKMLDRSGASVIIADNAATPMLEELLQQVYFTGTIILEGDPGNWQAKYPDIYWYKAFPSYGLIPEITAQPDDTAYLLFTSGTTGVPKGVPVSNRNVTAYLDHVLAQYNFTPDDRFSHTFDLTFDLSVHDMMVCWLSGACLCIPFEDTALKIAAYIRESRISVWFSVPSVASLMDRMRLLKPGTLESIRMSFFCGEPLPENIARKWRSATAAPVVNLYGPSEATIAISEYEAGEHTKQKNGIVSLGKLFPRQEYLLIDPETSNTTQTKGELCLSGSQVIQGYLDDQELNERFFFNCGEQEKRWYRTGDLMEIDTEGDLFFLGRTDAEVKISGFRVNLLEVDALIRKYNGAGMVATLLDNKRSPRLVSFAERTGKYDEKGLINRCRHELPWYMIPEVIIFVEKMPLNANGKIDRNALKNIMHG